MQDNVWVLYNFGWVLCGINYQLTHYHWKINSDVVLMELKLTEQMRKYCGSGWRKLRFDRQNLWNVFDELDRSITERNIRLKWLLVN